MNRVAVVAGIAFSTGGAGLALLLLSGDLALWCAVGVLVLGALSTVIDVIVINPLRVRHTRYSITPWVIRVRRGRLLRRGTAIATAQLLNVTVVQGPLLRRWGLARVRFTCIAHVEPLGPVRLEEAERIRAEALGIYLGVGR